MLVISYFSSFLYSKVLEIFNILARFLFFIEENAE